MPILLKLVAVCDECHRRQEFEISFWVRWTATLSAIGGILLIGLPVQVLVAGRLSWWSLLVAAATVAVCAFCERRWLAPERIRDARRMAWLLSRPRSPSGNHYLIDRAGWREHFSDESKNEHPQ